MAWVSTSVSFFVLLLWNMAVFAQTADEESNAADELQQIETSVNSCESYYPNEEIGPPPGIDLSFNRAANRIAEVCTQDNPCFISLELSIDKQGNVTNANILDVKPEEPSFLRAALARPIMRTQMREMKFPTRSEPIESCIWEVTFFAF